MWERALDHHSGQQDLERVAELHRKIGAGLAHKGERKQAIEHHQRGINLIKDGDPSLALVRLYEEAAWLYMQTGDNMLAIYASEKALRLAERLGEVRAASRAHGIFGRVFGRIGDTVKARENLERAVELARGSDAHETVLALMALGHHLESSDGDYARRRGRLPRGPRAWPSRSATCPPRSSCTRPSRSSRSMLGTGMRSRRSSDASAELSEREGLIGKLCLPYALRGRLHWRLGEWQESERAYRRAHELAEQIGWSEVCYDALYGLSGTLRDQGEIQGAQGALSEALDVCERAGLIVQSIQANSARALLHRLAGDDQGRARRPARRCSSPSACATRWEPRPSIEAAGVVGPLPEALEDLRSAQAGVARAAAAARGRALRAAARAAAARERPRARRRIAGAGCRRV